MSGTFWSSATILNNPFIAPLPKAPARAILREQKIMGPNSTSTQRDGLALLRFGLGFVGFLLGSAGVVTTSPAVAILGALLLLLIIVSFRRSDDS